MTTAEYEYALDLRMRTARGESVRPLTTREVAVAVRHAEDEGQQVALDLSGLKRIVVDPRAQTARVQPGITAAALAAETKMWGLAPLVDHRGGLVEANLLAAQVVLPDGELVDADDALLREIRTGHAVGIVVDATYRLHPVADLRR
jgi:FAD/FMN-containing dehydrogenase